MHGTRKKLIFPFKAINDAHATIFLHADPEHKRMDNKVYRLKMTAGFYYTLDMYSKG